MKIRPGGLPGLQPPRFDEADARLRAEVMRPQHHPQVAPRLAQPRPALDLRRGVLDRGSDVGINP
jgi:hypothetical protein